MDKKYLIVFLIVAVAAGGFFIYKNHANEKDLKTHESKQYKRMIQTAKKSSFSGLSHMGRALKKYRKEKGAYKSDCSEQGAR